MGQDKGVFSGSSVHDRDFRPAVSNKLVRSVRCQARSINDRHLATKRLRQGGIAQVTFAYPSRKIPCYAMQSLFHISLGRVPGFIEKRVLAISFYLIKQSALLYLPWNCTIEYNVAGDERMVPFPLCIIYFLASRLEKKSWGLYAI